MAISSMDRGVGSDTRAKIGLRHLRVDKWCVANGAVLLEIRDPS